MFETSSVVVLAVTTVAVVESPEPELSSVVVVLSDVVSSEPEPELSSVAVVAVLLLVIKESNDAVVLVPRPSSVVLFSPSSREK